MGFLSRFFSSPKPMRPIATSSFLFRDTNSANGFIAAAQNRRRQSTLDFSVYNQLPGLADSYGGSWVRSSTGRETEVYGNVEVLQAMDREYLINRDPTAMMFAEEPWADIWGGFPTTYIPVIDAYFSEQQTLGLLGALQACYQEYYVSGGAILYLEATGNPRDRLRRGDRPIAWRMIPAGQVVDTDQGDFGFILTEPNETDPLLDHGIELLSFYPTSGDRERNTPITVHGSRFIPINLNPKSRWWRTSKIPFNAVHDDLWNLRDIIWARTRAHFQGDPIVVDVDLSVEAQKVINFEGMSNEERNALSASLESSIAQYNTGAKSTFAPVLGFKMRRLGSADLPDPTPDIMAISSRLSHGSIFFTVKQVLASTKGNSDVGDQDMISYASKCQRFRNTWGYKHLSKCLLMGQVMGASGLRMQDGFGLPPPHDIEKDWPLIRVLTPRDAAFLEKTDAAIYRESQELGLLPPTRIQRKFAADSRYTIPLWLAGKGRLPSGKSADPKPVSPSSNFEASVTTEDARAIAQEEIEEHERTKARRSEAEEFPSVITTIEESQ